jgi:tetratricopeptide (TPR) repeat protein
VDLPSRAARWARRDYSDPMDVPQAQSIVALARSVFESRWDAVPGEARRSLASRVDEVPEACRVLLAAGKADQAALLVGSLSSFWQVEGLVDRGRAVTEEMLLAAGDGADEPAWAWAHLVLGELAFRQGDQEAADGATRRARDVAAAVGDTWLEAEAETNLARIAFRDADAERIYRHASRVEELADGRLRLRTKAEHMLGWAAHTAGDHAAAVAHFEANALLYRELGDAIGEAMEFANLADLALEADDDRSATAYLARALATPGIATDRYLAPSLVRSVGVLVARRGDDRTGLELMAGADAMYAAAGLEPDPGDELGALTWTSARERLGEEEAVAAIERGASRPGQESFRLAVESVASSS